MLEDRGKQFQSLTLQQIEQYQADIKKQKVSVLP
jgi:hypothetical protein